MEPRQLLAYAMIFVLVAGFLGAWLWVSRHRRGERRAYRKFERSRQQRRDERLSEERAG